MPDMFSDERKKLKTHTHIYTQTCVYTHEKGGRTNSKFKTTKFQHTHSHTTQKNCQ